MALDCGPLIAESSSLKFQWGNAGRGEVTGLAMEFLNTDFVVLNGM